MRINISGLNHHYENCDEPNDVDMNWRNVKFPEDTTRKCLQDLMTIPILLTLVLLEAEMHFCLGAMNPRIRDVASKVRPTWSIQSCFAVEIFRLRETE